MQAQVVCHCKSLPHGQAWQASPKLVTAMAFADAVEHSKQGISSLWLKEQVEPLQEGPPHAMNELLNQSVCQAWTVAFTS